MNEMTLSKVKAMQDRSRKIAEELLNEGMPEGWLTVMSIMGWMISTMPKVVADDLTSKLTEEIRAFPLYPKV